MTNIRLFPISIFFAILSACSEIQVAQARYGLGFVFCLLPQLKDKRMFAPANAAHFTLLIPSVRNDFKVLAFYGTEAISSLYSIQIELVSESPDFDLESLLSQPAFLQVFMGVSKMCSWVKPVNA